MPKTKTSAQDLAREFYATMREFVAHHNYSPDNVHLVTPETGGGRYGRWGVCVNISGLTFIPTTEQMDYNWGYGWNTWPWETPDGWMLENWSDGVTLVYER
jgi:hypothetical protein